MNKNSKVNVFWKKVKKEKQPIGLWLCGNCLIKMDVGNYLHIRRIETDYVKCKDCRKELAQFQFLTRNILKENYP